MTLEAEEISGFIKLWQEGFHEKLTPDEARHQASLLLEIYAVLYEPTPEEQVAGSNPPPQLS